MIHFEMEESVELLKCRLARRPKFNIRNVYKYVDCFDTDVITSDNFKTILQENGYYATNAEI